MIQYINAAELKKQLSDGTEIALLDTREHGEYGEGHPFYSTHLPYSRLELEASRLLPNKAVRVVLFGANDALANRAAHQLNALGYLNIKVLEQGIDGWVAAGYTLFKGVHVPSKTFGEMAEHVYQTPSLRAAELKERLIKNDNLIVLDGRSQPEYQKMTIPGAINCPNAELPYRIHKLVQDELTTIVVNCAGRTRSIIGAQSLINMGIKNPIYALENGTQGWYLNDFELENGSKRFHPDVSADDAPLSLRREAARALAEKHGVSPTSAAQMHAWLTDSERTTYLFDVRTAAEFNQESVPGAQHAEGGQLLQGTDLYIGVRHARVVLYDTDGVRARLTGSWLAQMGFETYVLDAIEAKEVNFTNHDVTDLNKIAPPLPELQLDEAKALLSSDAIHLLDIRPSTTYRKEHPKAAIWSIRSRITADIPNNDKAIVFITSEPELAALAATELPESLRSKASFVRADLTQWRNSGIPMESTPDFPADKDCIDFLFFVHDRHDGNKQAARQYLAWETNLIAQLDDQEKSTYRFPQAH